MKQRWILLAAALLLTGLTACQADRAASAPSHAGGTTARPGQAQTTGGTQAGEAAEVRVLIAWFSRTGHTEQLAEQIHSRVGGDMFRIETRQPYPQAYEAVLQRAEQERREDARPALSAAVENMEVYDVVFLGYPIWLGDVPMAVRTFLDSYAFSGKTVIPFCTSGGSPPETSFDSIRGTLPDTSVLTGFWISGADAAGAGPALDDWLADLDGAR